MGTVGRCCALFLVSAVLLLPGRVLALGFRLADQDPKATARGNAFVATADNPSAIYYNPAGIMQLDGHDVRLGGYGIWPNSDYHSPALGVSTETVDNFYAAPQVYYTFNPEKAPVAFGLGLYSPYGLGTEWPEDGPFRTIATDASIMYLSINPVLAVKPHKAVSLGVGFTANWAKAKFERGILMPGDRFEFEGDGWDFGWNAGVMIQPIEQISIGVMFRSATTVKHDGDSVAHPYTPEEDASARILYPEFIVAGLSYRPTPKWNLEFNIDWTNWDRLDDVTLNQAVSPDIVLPFRWQSSRFYEFGVTRYFDKGFSLSGGYIYSENSVPDRTFSPTAPDSERHIFSIGAGYKSDRWNVDLAYQLAYGPERTVQGSISPSLIGETADGIYEFMSHALTVAVGFEF
jgi:long-chain fatty acid transport protein